MPGSPSAEDVYAFGSSIELTFLCYSATSPCLDLEAALLEHFLR